MKYLIDTGWPQTGPFSRAKRIFKSGWWGSVPYFDMELPHTDGIGTQHVGLKLSNLTDGDVAGNPIAKAHIPARTTLVSHFDIQRIVDHLEDDSEEKALEMLHCMMKKDKRKYQGTFR